VLSFVLASTSMLFWAIFLLPFFEHGGTMWAGSVQMHGHTSIKYYLCSRWRYVTNFTHPAALHPQEITIGTHWTGAWVGSRAVLNILRKRKISVLCRNSSPGQSSR
jgi:hypothetical protein